LVPGGCPHPTGWWGHPNHRQLPQEVPGTRDPTTARYIRCLRGAVGLGPGWRRAGPQSAQGRKHAANCNGGRGEDCRGSGGPARLRLRMAILEQTLWPRRSPCETRVVTTSGFETKRPLFLPRSATTNIAAVLVSAAGGGVSAQKSSRRFHPCGQASHWQVSSLSMFLRQNGFSLVLRASFSSAIGVLLRVYDSP
jgi:hypothetical protein